MNQLVIKKLVGADAGSEVAPLIPDRYANTASAGSVIAFHEYRGDLQAGDLGVICSLWRGLHRQRGGAQSADGAASRPPAGTFRRASGSAQPVVQPSRLVLEARRGGVLHQRGVPCVMRSRFPRPSFTCPMPVLCSVDCGLISLIMSVTRCTD